IAIVFMEAEVSTAPFVAGLVAVPVCRAARRRLGWPRERVVAADAVDLKGNIVRLGLRVRRGAGLVRRGETVAADFLEQTRGGRVADVSDIDVDRPRARVARRRRAGTSDTARLRGATEPRLGVSNHVRETGRHGAQIDALRLAGVKDRVVQRRVLHGREVDGVSHLPASYVLEECGAGDPKCGCRRV